ncbi:TRAP transporter small permease [Microvirga arabica]|uniref:TRAP transporter small permease n=1 Tax=Microvirga arabica TaxID=1128671 RepID=UPI00193AAE0A|nr:TRAP transporter small permease [Microvirga arabica]MBM1172392.1 TRAP transporter small permease [Microvirga arabica]
MSTMEQNMAATPVTKLALVPPWLKGLAAASTGLNKTAAALAAVLLVLMTGHILLEIVLRFFSRSTYMVDALVSQGVAAITFLAMAWALEHGSMIRVDVLTQRLPRTMKWIAQFFAVISSMLLMYFLAYYEWRTLTRAWTRGTVSEHFLPIPLWIPEAIFFTGLLLLLLQLLVRLLRLLVIGHAEESSLSL